MIIDVKGWSHCLEGFYIILTSPSKGLLVDCEATEGRVRRQTGPVHALGLGLIRSFKMLKTMIVLGL